MTLVRSFFASASLLGLAWPAMAQQVPNDAGDIVVTAQKRSESVSRVPITISVLSSDQLQVSGINGTQQVELTTPGLVFGNTNGSAQPYIRGIGTDLITPGQESPVGFYLDGVYLPSTDSIIQEFGDIARIEVLKGPQGTLYGRNTTGGAVNIITRDPEQEFTANAQATIGTRGTKKFVGYVSGGLAPNIAVSLSGLLTEHDGFFRVINAGRRSDSLRQRGLRGKIKITPTDRITLTLSADYLRKQDSSAGVFTALVGSNATPPGFGPSFVPRETYTDIPNSRLRNEKSWGLNGTLRVDLDSVTFTSITGYRNDLKISMADGDSTALPLLAFRSENRSKSFTQELQLASAGESRLTWIAGLYYLHDPVAFDPVYVWAGAPVTTAPGTIIGGRSKIRSYAAFGQASYAVTDAIKIIAGLRYSNERRLFTKQTLNGFSLLDQNVRNLFGLGPVPQLKVTSDSLDPKITIQYDQNGQLVYGTFSKGFKSGSYNLISAGSPGPLKPEKITAFEVGGKHLLTENGLRINWSIFHYKYKDIQVNVKDAGVGGVVSAQNAASTINKGIDLDIILPVSKNLRFTVGGEYLDAKYKKFPNASVFNIVNGLLDTAVGGDLVSVDVSGNRAVRAPKLTLSATAEYILDTPIGEFTSTATFYHNSGYYFDPGNIIKQPSFQLVNLNLQYKPEGQENLSISVFANNLFNETVIQGINQTPYGIFGGFNAPRVIGASVGIKF